MGEAMTAARADDGDAGCAVQRDVRCLESQAKAEPVDHDLLFSQWQRVTRVEKRDWSFYDLYTLQSMRPKSHDIPENVSISTDVVLIYFRFFVEPVRGGGGCRFARATAAAARLASRSCMRRFILVTRTRVTRNIKTAAAATAEL